MRILFAAALLGAAPLSAQHPARTPAGWDHFTASMDRYAAGDSIVGGAAIMVRNGQIVAHHEYGWQDRAAGQRVDQRTLFHWASITKTLTAVAIMQLRDRGLLSLDDPAVKWVPELRLIHDPYGSIDSVTVRMLLSHSAGFQNPTWPYTNGESWQPFEPTSWDQLVAMMPYQKLLFKPGSRFGYSNPAFIYLARIIEAITGDDYQTYIQKNIWSPLRMDRSYFGATPYYLARDRCNNYTLEADSAGGLHLVANGRDFNPGITIPNSGWNAPLADLATWMAFLTGADRGDSLTASRYATVLRRSTLQEMWRPVVSRAEAVNAPELGGMGLSFFIYRVQGDTLIGHTGEQAGFRSFFLINPRTSTAIVANFNTINDVHPRESSRGFGAVMAEAEKVLVASR
ncbi:MAG TPA: serine hydrolase domain-containing protein [Gemmatimonadales bacterium]|nr:serine hydrolase domain-containing protein [Gemmatimonadales bacterium]